VRYVDIDNVYLKGASVSGIAISMTDDGVVETRSISITNCIFENIATTYGKGITLFQDAEYVSVLNCVFRNCTEAIEVYRSANLKVSHCTFLLCGSEQYQKPVIKITGITLDNANKTIITGCAINHFWYTAIIASDEGVFNHGILISNNEILVCSSATPYDCIDINGVIGAIITGNRLRPGAATYAKGVKLGINGAYKTDKCIVTNNIVLGGSISDESTATGNVIVNNITNIT
jgi:hypothetical protein